MKPAYADRATWLGDPEWSQVPLEGLIAKAYAERLRAGIDPNRARPAAEVKAGDPLPFEPTRPRITPWSTRPGTRSPPPPP